MTETDASAAEVGTALAGDGVVTPALAPPAGILIGYARCATEKQDLGAQREILRALGVADERVYLDHGLTGTSRSRPGLNNALVALREGDTLVVPKLDRLARSVPDARAIGDSLAARGVRLSLGGSVYDPSDPMGKCFFNILATFAAFEVDLLRMRTREGMAIARAKGRLKGKAPKLSPIQRTVLLKLHGAGEHSIAELGELFGQPRHRLPRDRTNTRQEARSPRALSDR
jgi:DNA invertase Pin-like site-specific DNA recombinase